MPVPRAVFTLAVPTVISQLIVLIYNLADTWFIGQTGDTLQVAAVTVSYPIFMLLSAFANLFGIGGGSLISRLLGGGKEDEAGKVGTFSLWAAGTVILFYSLAVWIFGGRMLRILGSGGQTLDFARQYLFWTVVIGGLPTVLNLVLANIVRAQGKAKVASIGMSVGGILNIILDPVFIFTLHMNVAGAALATCLSNTISMLYLLQHVVRNRKDSAVKLTILPRKVSAESIRDILSIGTPAALQILLASVSNSVMIRLMNGYTESAISGLGIAQKIEIIPFQVVQGISSGVLPLIAYNYASGDRKRMNDTVSFSIRLGLILSAVFFVLIETGAPLLVRFFIADPETITYGAAFTRLRCIALPFINIEFMLIAVFQGIGSARQALVLSFFRKGLLDLPLMILANLLWPMYGLMLVQPFMEFSGSMIALRMYRKQQSAHLIIPGAMKVSHEHICKAEGGESDEYDRRRKSGQSHQAAGWGRVMKKAILFTITMCFALLISACSSKTEGPASGTQTESPAAAEEEEKETSEADKMASEKREETTETIRGGDP